jgi:hypothetical protein
MDFRSLDKDFHIGEMFELPHLLTHKRCIVYNNEITNGLFSNPGGQEI